MIVPYRGLPKKTFLAAKLSVYDSKYIDCAFDELEVQQDNTVR